MHLTHAEIQGINIAVDVDEHGVFTAELGGEAFEEKTLGGLRRVISDFVTSSRHEFEFVATSGRRGVMRGIHAGTRDVLVTWADGTKGKLNPRAPVWLAGEIVEHDRVELELASAGIVEAEERAKMLRGELALTIEEIGGTREAGAVYRVALGEDLLAYGRREAVV